MSIGDVVKFNFTSPQSVNYRLFLIATTSANAASITAPVAATGAASLVFGEFSSALLADVPPLLFP